MYSLTVVFGPAATSWRLLYKSKEAADAAAHRLSIDTGGVLARVELSDDFGQVMNVNSKDVHAFMLENMDESKVGAVEYGLHNARTQTTYQQRVETDPTTRPAASRSTPILTPMGNGRLS